MPVVSLSISMNMDVRGEESSHRVAFVHGVGFHLERWDGVIRRLGPGVRSLRYDLRGLVQYLGWPRFDLIGFRWAD